MNEAIAPRTRIKICGLTREQDVDAAVAAGVDAVGFVLYPKSPRHVTAARAAGSPCVLVPYGYNHGMDVATLDADGVVSDLAALAQSRADALAATSQS